MGDGGRPVWLLDVDGVINVDRPGWGAPPRRGRAYSDGEEFSIRWAPSLIKRKLRALHDSGRVDVRWCTTWCADADQLERLFSLPRLGRAWLDPISSSAASVAKLAAARHVLHDGGRLIWTDDAVVPTSGPIHEELTASARALLIAPSPRTGLQPEHLDQIESFVETGDRADPTTSSADVRAAARRLLFGDDDSKVTD